MADGSLPTSKAGKQERRTCLHGNPECTRMRLELKLLSCSPHPGIPAFDLYQYCEWQGTRVSVLQDFAGKRAGSFSRGPAKYGSVSIGLITMSVSSTRYICNGRVVSHGYSTCRCSKHRHVIAHCPGDRKINLRAEPPRPAPPERGLHRAKRLH